MPESSPDPNQSAVPALRAITAIVGDAVQKAGVVIAFILWNIESFVSETRQQTLSDLKKYAEILESDPVKEKCHAGAFIRKAVHAFENPEDEYSYADAMHWIIGASEEIARYRLGDSYSSFKPSLDKLKISKDKKELLFDAYDVRNKAPGVGHRAGGASESDAMIVLFVVRHGLSDLLPPLPSSDSQ